LSPAFYTATVAASVASTLLIANPDWLAKSIARLADKPAHWWEKWQGTEFGTLVLEVQLPDKPAGRAEPLVTAGFSYQDAVLLEYVDATHVRIGLSQTGNPTVFGEPLAVDFSILHRVEIDAGFLCPPPGHPVYRGWSATDIERVRSRLEVKMDGHPVLKRTQNFHYSTPGVVWIAEGNAPDGARTRFTGTIQRMTHAPLERSPATAGLCAASGAVAIELRLPAPDAAQRLPLISTGVTGAGDLIYLETLSDGRVRFGHDNWGGSPWLTLPRSTDRAGLHSLVVQMAPLANGGPTHPVVRPLRLIWDGEMLIDVPRRFNPSEPEHNEVGVNAIRASTAVSFFTGKILKVSPLSPEEWEAEQRAAGDATRIPEGPAWLGVRFTPTPEADAEPLVVTGMEGQADFVFVRYEANGRLRFGIDHWGEGVVLGEPVAVDFLKEHTLEVDLQSLYPAGTPRPAYGLRLTLDGREVLRRMGACWPAQSEQIWVGLNPVGGSSCSARFSGEIRVLDPTRSRGQ
jgi:hypothetical protein